MTTNLIEAPHRGHGPTLRHQTRAMPTTSGEVEDHAADGSGFDLGHVFADLADLDAVDVIG